MKTFIAIIVIGFSLFGPKSVTQPTDDGLFNVELVVKERKMKQGYNPVEIVLTDAGTKPVEGAEIEITPWMPEMGHGVMGTPKVYDEGGGRYRATVFLSMGGHWEIRMKIRKADSKDKVIFNFPSVQGK